VPDYREERSPLWGIGAVGALGGGFALGMKGNWKDLFRAAGSATGGGHYAGLEQAVSRMSRFVRPTRTTGLDLLGDFAGTEVGPEAAASFKRDIATSAYEAILKGKTPVGHDKAYSIFKEIVGAPSAAEAGSIAQREIAAAGGDVSLFSKRVEQFFPGGEYTGLAKDMGEFRGMNLSLRQTETAFTGLSPEAQRSAEEIQTRLRRIFREGELAWSPSYHKAGGQEILSAAVGGSGGKGATYLNFPLRGDIGEMYGGPGFRNRYVIRNAWELTGQGVRKKNFSQMYLDALEAEASMAKSSVGLKQAVERARASVTEKSLIWGAPEETLVSGSRLKEQIAASQRVYTGGRISPAVVRAGIEAGGLPLGSPAQVAEGVLGDVDWRRQLLGPMGELMPVHRRPLQFVREGWQLSDIAKTEQAGTYARKGILGELSRFSPAVSPGFEGAAGGHVAPGLSTFYLKPGKTDYSKHLAEEMGIMSREAASLQKWERVSSYKLRVQEGLPLSQEILKDIEGKTLQQGQVYKFENPIPLEPGQGLGIGDKGQISKIRRRRGMQQFLMGYEVLDSGRIKAHVKEMLHMGEGDIQKFFSVGADIKHTITRADPQGFLRSLGVSTAPADVVVSGERLGKSPYALFSQQISGMQEFAAQRVDAIKRRGLTGTSVGELERYAKDPMGYLGLSEEFFARKDIRTMEQLTATVQNRIAVGAERLGLINTDYAPEIFGMMDPEDVHRMTEIAEELSEKTVSSTTAGTLSRAIERSVGVRGSTHMFLGDLVQEGGTGNMAKWEPSLFHWLAKGGPPGLGAKWAADVERRLAPGAAEMAPEAVEELTKMQKSLLGEDRGIVDRAMSGFAADEDFLSLGPDELVKAEGRWVDLGREAEALGSRRIFIPGYETAPRLGPLKTDAGELVRSEFESALSDLQYALKDQSDNATRKTAEAARNLQTIGQAQWSKAATLRERAVGTQLLAAQRLPLEEQAEEIAERTHRMTSGTASPMFEGMLEAAPDEGTAAFIRSQQEAFERGERVVGLVGRYPAVGPYSVQPTFFQKIDEMEFAEQGVRAQEGIIYSPDIEDEITITGKGRSVTKTVSKGQGVGQRLDYDLDRQLASFLSDQETAEETSAYLSKVAAGDYEDFLGRHYALQHLFEENQPAAVDVARGAEEHLASGAKHYAGQMGIGRTNIAMEKFRRTAALKGADFQAKYEPLLWHMEETATIMAKHGGAHAAEDLYTKYGRATAAIERGRTEEGARLMREAIEALGGKEQATLEASFAGGRKGISYSYNPETMGRELAEAYAEHHAEVRPALDIGRQSKRARVSIPEDEMRKQISLYKSRARADAAQAAKAQRVFGKAGVEAGIHRAAASGRSRLKAVSNVLKRGKGPMALGAATAAGILLMSPSVSGTLPANPNVEGAAGGRNLNPEDSIPPQGPGMTPPNSGMRNSSRAYFQRDSSTLASLKGSSPDFSGERLDETMRQIRQLGEARRSRINVSDNRDALDSKMLADRVYRNM